MSQAHESQKGKLGKSGLEGIRGYLASWIPKGKIRKKWFGGHKRVSSRSYQQKHQWL